MPSATVMITEEGRFCTGCLVFKLWPAFAHDRTSSTGHRARCLDCCAAYQRARSMTEAEKQRNRDSQRRHRIRQYKGMTPERYEEMVLEQQGLCAACGDRPRRLCIDHDHTTGEVRRLLCADCNAGIGLFRDDPGRLLAAALYLMSLSPNGDCPARATITKEEA